MLRANALNLPLADESVDLIITSPPYFALRSYRDAGEHCDGQIGSEPTPQEFLEALWAATAEMKRVLKPSGSIWVNLGDKYAGSGGHNNSTLTPDSHGVKVCPLCGHEANRKRCNRCDVPMRWPKRERRNAPDRYNQNSGGVPAKSLMGLPWRYAIGCIDQLGLILRAEVVWSKPNGLPESVTDRVRRSHEQWFHFTKSPRYFAAVDEVREPHATPIHAPGNRKWASERNDGDRMDKSWGDPSLGKLPGSVWTVPSEPLRIPDDVKESRNLPDHFAAFPSAWPIRIIAGWSPTWICTACGEGRRPVVETEYVPARARGGDGSINRNRKTQILPGDETPRSNMDRLVLDKDTTITGYACACPDTNADTRPAVVLDPFGGTGTVAMAAKAMGRIGISVDLSHDYCRLADWRINESGHGDKALRRAVAKGWLRSVSEREAQGVVGRREPDPLRDVPPVVGHADEGSSLHGVSQTLPFT